MKTIHGINYSLPKVLLLQETGIGTAEYAARTCYDSFDASENSFIKAINSNISTITSQKDFDARFYNQLANIEHSDLLDKLAWTHFHHSILEHANLTYLIKGTSRGVLQEHARHRLQAISVRSTRYTMSNVLNAFVAELAENITNSVPSPWFLKTIRELDLFVTTGNDYNNLQATDIFRKLSLQCVALGYDEFVKLAIAKSSLDYVTNIKDSQTLFNTLEAGKSKRNVGDAFKHLVNDNFKTDLVVTFNLRSLKNYLELRASGSAYFQIQWLAEGMIKATPRKYLDLIMRENKITSILGT